MDASQRRHELLARLARLDPPSAEECFVLLWSYLDLGRIIAAENLARAEGVQPHKIEPYPLGEDSRAGLARAGREAATLGSSRFDLLCVRLLKALDGLFKTWSALGYESFLGVDGEAYTVRRRNHFIADFYEARATSQQDQSGSRDLYARVHAAVPARQAGISILCYPQEGWGGEHLHNRLAFECLECKQLRIMLWPLQLTLKFPSDSEPSEFISLAEVQNEEELQEEVKQALAKAREEKVTLLILPELSIPPATERLIRATLKQHGPQGHPLLTLVGCCHRRNQEGTADLNEAGLFGPDGQELPRHRKLSDFAFATDPESFCQEQLEVGTAVRVLECAFGNVTPLICLDLIHVPLGDVLRRTHANVFAVPSLSKKTSAHRAAALQLQASNRASTFVSNRWLTGLTSEATSFYQVPIPGASKLHIDPTAKTPPLPYLLFSLEDARPLDKAAK